MTSDILDVRRQARRPRNYLILWIAGAVLYAGWLQGWPTLAALLCGPSLVLILVRLIVNEAEGFRLTAGGIEFYDAHAARTAGWDEVRWVTISDDGRGRARCALCLAGGGEADLPAVSAFAPDRLAEEFEKRGVMVRKGAVTGGRLAHA